ncbi:MAG: TonB-dependent receptor [Arenimonas sp.]
MVESISAEDIGKLPDSSIAESIARLPGLTAQRERGRATQIHIRGFAGDFAGTTLNGREQTTTSDNRGVEFDQYPSELLSSVVVYKTPDATLVGQGLSGTVDLRTARPLDYAERVLSGNFRVEQNENRGQEQNGHRYSFAYIDQFLDRTVGLAIGYSHLDSPTSGFQNEAWGYPNERWDGANQVNVPSVPGNPGVGVFGGGKVYKFDNSNKRDGLLATLQFKPNDFYETTLDLFYSKFKKTEIKTGLEFGTVWGNPALIPTAWTIDGNTATSSTWTGVKPVLRMDSNPSEDKLRSIGWNNKWTVNDHWTISGDLSYSKTEHDFRVLETYAGVAANNGETSLIVTLNPDEGFNEYQFGTDFNDPSNLRLIDAGGWGQDGYLKDFEVTDRLTALRLDATRSFDSGFLSNVRFGFNRTDRSKEKSSIEAKLCIVACLSSQDSAPFPGSAGDFGIGGIDGLAFYDANDLLESGFYNLVSKFHKDIANKNWGVDETLDTYFVQANVDTDIGTMPLRGNFGFQYVRVDQSSSGFNTFDGNPDGSPVELGASYSNFLPSLNLNLEVAPELYIRFAAAKQMARPRLDDMRASFDVKVEDGGCANQPGPLWCASGGNPQLKPWLANAYDLSVEKYFTTAAGNKGYVSVAYFFKDLQTWISKGDRPFDFAGYDLPDPDPDPDNNPASTVGNINQPFNGEGGLMKGSEVTVSVPLDILWGKLNGFGLQASYSDTKSSVPIFGSAQALPGLSKYVSNVTAYYEHAGFSVRFSQRKRSKYVGETRGFGADLGYIDVDAETVQDAQVNYTFQPGNMLEGLSFYLQVSNIGDEPFTTSDANDSENRPIQYFEYGRTTLLGFSYKF